MAVIPTSTTYETWARRFQGDHIKVEAKKQVMAFINSYEPQVKQRDNAVGLVADEVRCLKDRIAITKELAECGASMMASLDSIVEHANGLGEMIKRAEEDHAVTLYGKVAAEMVLQVAIGEQARQIARINELEDTLNSRTAETIELKAQLTLASASGQTGSQTETSIENLKAAVLKKIGEVEDEIKATNRNMERISAPPSRADSEGLGNSQVTSQQSRASTQEQPTYASIAQGNRGKTEDPKGNRGMVTNELVTRKDGAGMAQRASTAGRKRQPKMVIIKTTDQADQKRILNNLANDIGLGHRYAGQLRCEPTKAGIRLTIGGPSGVKELGEQLCKVEGVTQDKLIPVGEGSDPKATLGPLMLPEEIERDIAPSSAERGTKLKAQLWEANAIIRDAFGTQEEFQKRMEVLGYLRSKNRVVLRCSPAQLYKLMSVNNGRLVLGFQSAWIREDLDPTQCYYCQAYGHTAKYCPKKEAKQGPTCGRCTQNHDTRECKVMEKRCANCDAEGWPAEGHRAGTGQCPVRQQQICAMLNRRNYKGITVDNVRLAQKARSPAAATGIPKRTVFLDAGPDKDPVPVEVPPNTLEGDDEVSAMETTENLATPTNSAQ